MDVRSTDRWFAFPALIMLSGAGAASAQSPAEEQTMRVGAVETMVIGPADRDGTRRLPSSGERGPSTCAPPTLSPATGYDRFCIYDQVTVQGGFGPGEGFGVTFEIPAGHFPIRILQVQVPMGSFATGTGFTVTRVSFLVFDGEPVGGATPVFQASSSSDGSTGLEHVRIPHLPPSPPCNPSPGAVNAGVLANVILCTDDSNFPGTLLPPIPVAGSSGTNRVTVVFRIDQHSDGSAVCATASPCANAFFCSERGNPLNNASRLWVLAQPCPGPFSYPAGYTRVSVLALG